MREIVLDTETTGISAADGHRIIEIGALELVNHTPPATIYISISTRSVTLRTAPLPSMESAWSFLPTSLSLLILPSNLCNLLVMTRW